MTQYKEALASREWSNLSPSNAYQNYVLRKNLVGEIQKLAKELNKIPTEEAKILADLSKSKFSQDGGISNGLGGPSYNGNGLNWGGGLGGLHSNGAESSVLMDLNRASLVAQKEAEAASIKQQAKRIVDDSATRLEPVM